MRLLYLEDYPVDADLAMRVLARTMPDLDIVLVHELAAARKLLDDGENFDLALLDMKLPDGDGLDILAEIRHRQLPVATVLLTGSGDEQSVIRALKLQADDYLVKRTDYLERLPATLTYALERCRREHSRRSKLLCVLYAEHNHDDAELTRMHFARHAPHIRLEIVPGAAGVLACLEREDAKQYQVLLLDYRLAGMDALELIKNVRQTQARDLPIVLVTGRGSEEAAAVALRFGISDYLIKEIGYLDKLPSVLEHVYTHAELRHERARLQYMATYDELTGLLNRTEFVFRAEQALRRAHRSGERCALLMVDLDNFKVINDTFGHAAGDNLLCSFANRLRTVLRDEDLCGRFGGDEFLILLERVEQLVGAAQTAERIAEILLTRLPAGDQDMVVNASIGIAISPNDGDNINTLIKNADTAMYKTKAGGRNGFRFFDQSMNQEVSERFQVEVDLRHALERDELFMVYQPQINLLTNAVVGVEALIRWHHPTRGLLGPDQFIPIAESSALIIPLGVWVLNEACRQLKVWDSMGLPPLRMAINISARQFRSGGLDQVVLQTLLSHALPPERIELELTETAMADDSAIALTTLAQFKSIGVSLAIDDFGTGFSSLACLNDYPLDRLKIDKSFVAEIGHHDNGAAISEAVIVLAKLMGMESVAEGVEDIEQMNFLREHGCLLAQGYFISPPVAAETLVSWLGEWQNNVQ
jgi:diguanylate cyclase (GGDEF)-like protein